MVDNNNLQARRWMEDPAQCEKFFSKVEPRIVRVIKYVSHRHRVGTYQKDIMSEIEIEFLQEMRDRKIPFAEASLEEAANFFLDEENYWILNRGSSIARRIAGQQSKEQPTQAEFFDKARQPDLPPDIEEELLATAAIIFQLISGVPDLTPREIDISGKELLRQICSDNLSAKSLDKAAQTVGVSSSQQLAYNQHHDKHGQNSPSDRKAWSRAKAKIKKTFTKGKFTSLLGIVFSLSLALFICIHQGRSDHQRDFVGHNRPLYLAALLKSHQ